MTGDDTVVSTQPRRPLGKALKVAHLAWAALAITAAAVLALVPQSGHPPPVILLPFVALAWPVGHAAIWGVAYLAAKGRESAPGHSESGRSWPVAVILVLIGTGVASVIGLAQLVETGLQGRWYPYRDPALWVEMLAVWSAHSACLVGLLLRKKWSRFLSAILASGWAVLLAAQLAEHLTSLQSNTLADTVLAIGLLLLLVVLALHLVASHTVRSFLTR
jgi:hypothetical protein